MMRFSCRSLENEAVYTLLNSALIFQFGIILLRIIHSLNDKSTAARIQTAWNWLKLQAMSFIAETVIPWACLIWIILYVNISLCHICQKDRFVTSNKVFMFSWQGQKIWKVDRKTTGIIPFGQIFLFHGLAPVIRSKKRRKMSDL